MGAPTGANGSCYIAPREFLMGATRLLHMETPSELYWKLLEGSEWELLMELPWSS